MKSRKKFIYCYLRFFFGNYYFFNEMLQDDEQDDDAIDTNDDSWPEIYLETLHNVSNDSASIA